MNSNHPHQSVRDRILEKIERDEVRMHSRAYFALKIAGVLALAVLALLVTIFIGNFVFFMLRINGHGALLSLGTMGWLIFLRVFPWGLLLLDIALVTLLVWTLRRFQFGYRTPVLVIFFLLMAGALAAGLAVDEGTSLNDSLLHDADRGELPHPFDSVYKGVRRAPPSGSAYRGTVLVVEEGFFLLADPDFDDVRRVILPADRSVQVTVNETVLVIGSEDDGVIRALNIQELAADALPPSDDR